MFFFIFLILPLVDLYPQERDTSRIRVLKDLCWENRITNPPDALSYGHQALMLVKQLESYEYEATINNYLGIIQRNVGDHATALEYFFNAKRIAEEQKNSYNTNMLLLYILESCINSDLL